MEIKNGIPLTYQQRQPEKTKLYEIIRQHVNTFFAERELEGRSVPKYIRNEFDNYLKCGIFAHGFVRVHCDTCNTDYAIPFSCKGRGLCTSCASRRMTETAIHLDDNVIPHVPVRQFVLTLPVPVRLWAARSKDLLGKICAIACEEIEKLQTNNAGFNNKSQVQGGMVAFVQRFGSALNLNIHGHILALDGVFEEKSTGRMKFYNAKAPTNEDVADLISKIAKRINKYLVKKFYLEERDGDLISQDTTTLFEQDDLHLPSMAASLASKIAFGENQGKPVKRLYANGREWGSEDDVENKGERCAICCGYSLHANTSIKAPNRERLKQLIGYMARPAISEDRLEIIDENRVRIRLKSAWSDGTTHLELTHLEAIEKLMALIPLPYFHLTRYFGILSPHAKHRHQIIPPPKEEVNGEANNDKVIGKGSRKKKYIPWAELLKRTFSIDILKCCKCGGRMIVDAVIKEAGIIRLTLTALGLDPKPPDILPARPTTVFSEDW